MAYTTPAIVLGLSGMNSLNIIRSLGEQGVPVIGTHTTEKYPYNKLSKYLKESHIISSDDLLGKLIDIQKNKKNRGVLFAPGDDEVLFIDSHRLELEPYYHLPVLENGKLMDSLDKYTMLDLGRQSGFSIPQSYEDIASVLDEKIAPSYPLLTKPKDSLKGSKFEMVILRNADELKTFSSEKNINDFILQEYVEEPITSHYEVHISLIGQTPVVGGMLQKTTPAYYGDVTKGAAVSSVWNEELAELGLSLARKAKFSGPLDINVIKHDDAYYFLEVNYRMSANASLNLVAGRNIPLDIYCAALGEAQKPSTSIRPGLSWVAENQLYGEVLQDRLSYDAYVSLLQNADTFAFSHSTDHLPIIAAIQKASLFPNPRKL